MAELPLRFLERVRCLWMAVKTTGYRVLAWLLLELCCVPGALLHHGLQLIFLSQATRKSQGSEIARGAWKHRACCGLVNAVGFCYLHLLLHLMESRVGLLWETCRGFASTVQIDSIQFTIGHLLLLLSVKVFVEDYIVVVLGYKGFETEVFAHKANQFWWGSIIG